MISLPTSIETPVSAMQAPRLKASGREMVSQRPHIEGETNSADSLRRFIATRTGESLVVAFMMGGFLGWLTSKR